jgi:hypothetical protein
MSRRLDEMHSRTNVKLMNLTVQVLELAICGILKLKVVFPVQIRVLLAIYYQSAHGAYYL